MVKPRHRRYFISPSLSYLLISLAESYTSFRDGHQGNRIKLEPSR